jgi:ribosomal protein S18 acetylase RimI-like enzyme
MSSDGALPTDLPVNIRSFRAGDLPACRTLYVEGLLGGKLAENDTGLDIDDIEFAYMKPEGNHFWVAETIPQSSNDPPRIVGMIGVQHHDEGAADISRLHNSEHHTLQRIGWWLIEAALRWCHDRNYLKVTLDTFMEREPAIKLFEKFQFRHSRTRDVHGKELLYFYLDIYGREGAQPHP